MSGEQSVVVTGVSTGIGFGTCKVLLSKGFRVFGSVRRKVDADRLQIEFGDAFNPLIMEVTDKQAIEQAAARAEPGSQPSRIERRRRMMNRGRHGSRPITRHAPIKHMAIPKGVERPGIATKQNGNANRTSSIAEPRPLSACFNSASVSDLPFTRTCKISRSVDRCDCEVLLSVVIVTWYREPSDQ